MKACRPARFASNAFSPSYVDAWCNKGVSFLHAGREARAIECFTAALKLDPNAELALMTLGILHARRGAMKDAVDLLSHAASEDRDYATLWLNLGTALLESKDPDKALQCFNVALGRRPEFAEAWLQKGRALLAAGKADEAEFCLERALRIRPSLAAAREELDALREAPP